MATVHQALSSLCPGALYYITGNGTYQEVVWEDTQVQEPSEEEVNAEIVRLDYEGLLADCKTKASALLYETDWTTIPDVADSSNSPYLTNQAEFITWRNQVRKLAVTPVVDPVFPPKPTEIWG